METKTVMMPRELTAENGAKALLLGEFSVGDFIECGRCDGGDASSDDEYEEFEQLLIAIGVDEIINDELGNPFVKAHKEIIKKIVVGMPGTNTPTKARLTQIQPKEIRTNRFIKHFF